MKKFSWLKKKKKKKKKILSSIKTKVAIKFLEIFFLFSLSLKIRMGLKGFNEQVCIFYTNEN